MDLKLELLARVTITLGLILFIGRFLAPILTQFFHEKFFPGKRHQKPDLDTLIRRKEEQLRSGLGLKETFINQEKGQTAHSSQEKKYTSKTEEYYLREFEKKQKNQNHQKIEGLPQILGLLDSAKWGAGKEYHQVAQNLSRKLNCRIEDGVVAESFQRILKNNDLVGPQFQDLPSYQTVESYLFSYVFLTQLSSDVQKKEGQLLQSLAKKFNSSSQAVSLAFFQYLLEFHGKSPGEALAELLKKEPSDNLINFTDKDLIPKILFQTRPFLSLKDLREAIKERALVASMLTPFPELEGPDALKKAYEILGVNENDDLGTIKKQYRTLAKLKHPDRLSGLNLPSEFQRLAAANFTLLKKAYDMIKQGKS